MTRWLAATCIALALVADCCAQDELNNQSDIAGIRNEIGVTAPVWVAQEVSFSVELLSAALFSGTPRFELPRVRGVILMKVEGSPVLGTKVIDGETWSVQRHEFRAYAHRPGLVTIPPFPVRFSVTPTFTAPPEEQRMLTESMSFESRLPPGAEGVSLLISTTDLKVIETWDPKLDSENSLNLQVGDAITRTIAMQATDVPGMALPPIEMPPIEGLAAYPQSPVVSDAADRGSLTGKRTESVTYVCERPGTMTIPELVITWWDIKSSELNRVTLPAATITVNADETTSNVGSETTSQPASSASDRRLPLWIGLLVVAMLIAAWLSRPSWSAWLEARRQRQAGSEWASYARVEQACRDNDATKAFNALMAWIDQTIPSTQANTLETFSRQVSDSTLTRELERLQRAVVHRDTNWNGQPLSDALNRFRRHRDAPEKRTQFGRTALPDLNP